MQPTLGVYLHIPFCERICPYCDFAVVAARRLAPEDERRYVDALLAELALRAPAYAGRRLVSIYFGGGTPSRLAVDSIGRLIEALRSRFAADPAIEVTLEANPGTLEAQRLPGFRDAGVNRLSLGVQSFDDATLKRLGRAHRAREIEASLAAARAAAFDALSLDLIFAAPGQTLADWQREVRRALALRPGHLSLYELSYEARTPFGRAAARGRLQPADDEVGAAMFECAEHELGSAGYEHYEISNYALPGQAARHNQRYWRREPVLGLGVGAVSSEAPGPGAAHGARRHNPRDLARYLAAVHSGRPDECGVREELTPEIARGEAVFLALRTAQGLDAERFRAEFGALPRGFWPEPIDRLCGAGLLAEGQGGDLRLTARGRLLADSVASAFVALPGA